jgi:hypothetical protein
VCHGAANRASEGLRLSASYLPYAQHVRRTNLLYRLIPDNFCGSFEATVWTRPSSLVEPVVVGGAAAAIAKAGKCKGMERRVMVDWERVELCLKINLKGFTFQGRGRSAPKISRKSEANLGALDSTGTNTCVPGAGFLHGRPWRRL